MSDNFLSVLAFSKPGPELRPGLRPSIAIHNNRLPGPNQPHKQKNPCSLEVFPCQLLPIFLNCAAQQSPLLRLSAPQTALWEVCEWAIWVCGKYS